MIDILSFCLLYKRYKIIKIKQIYRYNNPTDLITKDKLFLTFKIFININYVNLNIIQQIK